MANFDKYKQSLDAHKSVNNHQLEEKMRLMALMVMCWKLEPNKRVVHFTDIARCCSMSETKVEFALMRAMSVGLISGKINQVNGTVTITKVRPRDIDASGVTALLAKVDQWSNKVDTVMNKLAGKKEEE